MSRLDSIAPTPPRTLWELFLGFLSIGARSFGGVLPAAHSIMVEKRRWLTPGSASRRAPQVSMMQSTDARHLHTLPWLGNCTLRARVRL